MKKDIDYINNQNRSNNIRIDGIPEVVNENTQKTEQLVLNTLKETLDVLDQLKQETLC